MKYSAILVAFEELCSPNTYKKKKHKFFFFFSNVWFLGTVLLYRH